MKIAPIGARGKVGRPLVPMIAVGSRISCDDLARALDDELEEPRHSGARFSITY